MKKFFASFSTFFLVFGPVVFAICLNLGIKTEFLILLCSVIVLVFINFGNQVSKIKLYGLEMEKTVNKANATIDELKGAAAPIMAYSLELMAREEFIAGTGLEDRLNMYRSVKKWLTDHDLLESNKKAINSGKKAVLMAYYFWFSDNNLIILDKKKYEDTEGYEKVKSFFKFADTSIPGSLGFVEEIDYDGLTEYAKTLQSPHKERWIHNIDNMKYFELNE